MLARMMNDFGPLALRSQMNRLFEDFFEDLPVARSYAVAYPPVNVWEDQNGAHLEAELPGLAMEDLDVSVIGNKITISGQRKIAGPEGATCYRSERAQGTFSRTLSLSWAIDPNKVEAKLQDGVLSVYLPKAESAKPRKVQIQSA
jgi:HSP20 family protein